MTIMMMIKVLCLFVIMSCSIGIIEVATGKRNLTLTDRWFWGAITTAFIVMQWMI